MNARAFPCLRNTNHPTSATMSLTDLTCYRVVVSDWQQLRELKMDGITVLIVSMMFFICFVAWGFVIAFSYGNMKGDEQKEDGVKKEPEDAGMQMKFWNNNIAEVNNNIAEAIGDIEGEGGGNDANGGGKSGGGK
ncbi:hypothetical protein J1N35_030447 [Gossypium stocksii]|uniref:Uncharacterized protein n=1 Tax=Gossypium stocksii TaxID=47602 RepID=A0A9D3UZA6_9ROSI|nr:hypothetical protein J1N35_030447 [Gossypium stocksii]